MNNLESQLRIDEGYRNKVYLDSKGIPTIGVGRNLRDVGLSPDEIDLLLQNDIKRAQGACRAIFDNYDTLPQDKQDALANMAFNLGQTRLSGFKKMIAAVEKRDWKEAAAEAEDSDWYEQVGQRAVRICAILGSEE
jgi:lysozyme